MSILHQITNGESRADSARPWRGRSGRMAQVLGGLLVLGLVSLSGGCKDATTVAATPEPPEVQVNPVLQQDIPIYAEWVGTTVGYVTAQMRARVSGYLMSQEYTEGAFVKTGDLLFRIDPHPYQAAVDQAEGNHALAQAQLEQSRAQLAQAMAAVTQAQANQRRTELDVNRYAPLAQDGSVSQQKFDNAAQNNLANQAAVEAARANVEVARANFLRMQATVQLSGAAQRGRSASLRMHSKHTPTNLDYINVNLDYINAPTGSSADDMRNAGLWNIGVALERLRTEMETCRATGPYLPRVLREQLTGAGPYQCICSHGISSQPERRVRFV